MKKLFLGLMLCIGATISGMENPTVPPSQVIQRVSKKEYQDWLQSWKLEHSAFNLAWYFSLSIYRDVHELEQRVRASKAILHKQIDREIMPFDAAAQPFKDGVQSFYMLAARDLAYLNFKIKRLEMLQKKVEQERHIKSKL